MLIGARTRAADEIRCDDTSPVSSPGAQADDWRAVARVLTTVMISVTVLQRFAIPGTGGVVGVGFALGICATGLGLGQRILQVDPARVAMYTVAMSGLLLTLFFKFASYSSTSFLMLAVMYMPFVAVLPVTEDEYRRILGIFQAIMAGLTCCGLVQISVQFAAGPDWMFPLDQILPKSFFIGGFNLQIPVTEGMAYLKSTGLVFLEPSHFSQFLALSIVVEIAYFRRLGRLALLAAAYVTSFSGTGLVILGVVAVPIVLRSRQYWLLLLVIVVAIALPLLQNVPLFALFFDRLNEFDNPLGSGSMRFFGPFWLTDDVLFRHPTEFLFGYGPGSIGKIKGQVDYEVSDSSWLKLLVEYGLVGTFSFLPFYTYVLFARSADRLLSLACLAQFMLLGGFLNSFYVQFLHLALVGWPVIAGCSRTIAPRDVPEAGRYATKGTAS
jgi:hypothetical protein